MKEVNNNDNNGLYITKDFIKKTETCEVFGTIGDEVLLKFPNNSTVCISTNFFLKHFKRS